MNTTRRGFHALTLALGVSLCLGPALAQDAWPAKAIRLIVPFPPGGGTDLVARAMGQKLAERLGQPIVIDNKPGASTIIGTDAVAKAAPDGYTLLLSSSTSYTVNPALRAKLPCDPMRDLAPIAIVARAPLVLVVGGGSNLHSVKDLTAAAKATPRGVRYATLAAARVRTSQVNCWPWLPT